MARTTDEIKGPFVVLANPDFTEGSMTTLENYRVHRHQKVYSTDVDGRQMTKYATLENMTWEEARLVHAEIVACLAQLRKT